MPCELVDYVSSSDDKDTPESPRLQRRSANAGKANIKSMVENATALRIASKWASEELQMKLQNRNVDYAYAALGKSPQRISQGGYEQGIGYADRARYREVPALHRQPDNRQGEKAGSQGSAGRLRDSNKSPRFASSTTRVSSLRPMRKAVLLEPSTPCLSTARSLAIASFNDSGLVHQ
ncbi:hypothetical protein M011DRAFT_69275 [Sporormia fimetaria CBS 119925]|uniref:Uncharacterized protein n=1 Tax=Sporormia fimetaria CBS 119925 TaxID=1340428 RepID=A0A6A6VAF3_9PLEO|nr:hypothetical protein M011DRAFT_69275 [Sporormia fimetaria CBS 119925]